MSKNELAQVLHSLAARVSELEARARTLDGGEESLLIDGVRAALASRNTTMLRELVDSNALTLTCDAPRWRAALKALFDAGHRDDALRLLARSTSGVSAGTAAALLAHERGAEVRAFILGLLAANRERYEALAPLVQRTDDESPPPQRKRAQSTRTRRLVDEFMRDTYTPASDGELSVRTLQRDFREWAAKSPDERKLSMAALRTAFDASDVATHDAAGRRVYRLAARSEPIEVCSLSDDDDEASSDSEQSDDERDSMDDFIVDDIEEPRKRRRASNPFIDDEAGAE